VNAVPPFELTATYDEVSLRAAGRVLFRRYWKSQLPFTASAVLSVFVAAALLWYVRVTWWMWFPSAYLVAVVILWAFTRWNIRRRLMKRLGKSVQVRLTLADFSIISEGESHTFPWARFKSTLIDEHNLYLFITKRAAFVFPTQGLTPEAQQFAVTRVGLAATAV
jgi:hypothetical protein